MENFTRQLEFSQLHPEAVYNIEKHRKSKKIFLVLNEYFKKNQKIYLF